MHTVTTNAKNTEEMLTGTLHSTMTHAITDVAPPTPIFHGKSRPQGFTLHDSTALLPASDWLNHWPAVPSAL